MTDPAPPARPVPAAARDDRRAGNAAAAWGSGIGSAVAYGLTPTVAAIGYAGGVSPSVLVCLRSLLGAALLLSFAAATGRLTAVPWRPAIGLCLLCGPLFGLQLLCFFAAVRVTGAQVAVVLVHIYPLFVLLLVWARTKRRLPQGQLIVAVVMIGGIGLVGSTGSSGIAPAGAVLSLLSAAGYALYLVAGERWVQQVSVVTAGSLVSLGAGLTAGTIAVFDGSTWTFAAAGWSSILLQGLLLMPIGIGCSFLAVRALGSASVSLLGLLEPVVGVLAAQLLLGEQLSPIQWAGMAVVLASSAALPWLRRTRRRHQLPRSPAADGSAGDDPESSRRGQSNRDEKAEIG